MKKKKNKDNFVTLEISDLLKSKGFNEPCLYYYDENGIGKFWSEHGCLNSIFNDFVPKGKIEKFAAPLWQQLVDWLKNEKKILVSELWDGWEIAREDEDFNYFKDKETAFKKAIKLIP